MLARALQFLGMQARIASDRHPVANRTTSVHRLVVLGFLAVAAFFLVSEHRAHVVAWLPYLLLLACPVMHLLHRGHHRGHVDAPDGGSARRNL